MFPHLVDLLEIKKLKDVCIRRERLVSEMREKTKTSNLGTKLRILSGYENSCEWLQRKSTMGYEEK